MITISGILVHVLRNVPVHAVLLSLKNHVVKNIWSFNTISNQYVIYSSRALTTFKLEGEVTSFSKS